MDSRDSKVRRRYQGQAGQQYHSRKRAIPQLAEPWVARFRARKIAPFVGASDTVVEYGVGLGWNLAELKCARRIGYDVGEFLEAPLRGRGIEFTADPNTIPSGSVDGVVCHHTLEHAWEPAAVLATIHDWLRPKGRLLLFVPYEKERRYRKFTPDEPNHHLYSWNVQTLGNLVQDAGFVIQSANVAPFGQERFAAIWAARLNLGEGGFRALRWVANSLKREQEVRIVAEKAEG